jgi:hypothetical protein
MLCSAGHHGSVEAGHESLDGAARSQGAVDSAAHHGELVTLETADEVTPATIVQQTLTQCPEHGVPRFPPECPVHMAEPVHSEDDDGCDAPGSSGFGEGSLETDEEIGMAADSG